MYQQCSCAGQLKDLQFTFSILPASQKELQSKINEAGSRKLRALRMVNDGASTSSKDSGLSSSTTAGKQGKKQTKKVELNSRKEVQF
jgi:hypothetical protein